MTTAHWDEFKKMLPETLRETLVAHIYATTLHIVPSGSVQYAIQPAWPEPMMSCSHVGVQCTPKTDFQDPVVPLQPCSHVSSVLCASSAPYMLCVCTVLQVASHFKPSEPTL